MPDDTSSQRFVKLNNKLNNKVNTPFLVELRKWFYF